MLRSSPPGSTLDRTGHDDVDTARDGAKWFRQPVVWLGALIFLVSLLACIAMIVLASRHADVPVETVGPKVMKVPTGHQAGAR